MATPRRTNTARKPAPRPAGARATGARKAPSRNTGGRAGGIRWGRLFRNILVTLFVLLIVGPVLATIVYRFVPPPITILMVERMIEGKGLDHRWRPLSEMAPSLPTAAIAAEDARFCTHHGFDFAAMEKAASHNEQKPGKIRGGSTISQQTAKNVFLWPDRSYIRKGFEAYFTVLIETIWGKHRIMEVYLNTVEMGPGVYGVEAAAQKYFHVTANEVSPAQAARLIAILPSPLKWQVIDPSAYVRRRDRKVGAGEGAVERQGGAECL